MAHARTPTIRPALLTSATCTHKEDLEQPAFFAVIPAALTAERLVKPG
jgi:hypothetical protein